MVFRSLSKRFAGTAILLGLICATGAAYGQNQSSTASLPTAPSPQTQSDPDQSDSGQSNPPAQQSQSETGQEDKNKTQEQTTGTSKDRLFYTLPNFLTIDNMAQVPRMTAKQKFSVVARGSFDYVEYPWYAFLAGISQAENSEPGYGQGAEGYGKRYGAAFADGTIENFWTSAILPSVLQQDPRFYQMPEGTFVHRTEYAVRRIFVTRTDSGRSQFNFSEIFGSAISAVLSTYTYHPKSDRTIGNTASVWGSQVGYDTLTIEVKEFWPDIRRMIHNKRQSSNQTP
jgi:hypothetical protein